MYMGRLPFPTSDTGSQTRVVKYGQKPIRTTDGGLGMMVSISQARQTGRETAEVVTFK